MFTQIQMQCLDLIAKHRMEAVPTRVQVRDLTPEEAIGNPEHRDYPLIKGRERLLEADILGSKGQAFTDTPGGFSGTLMEAADLPMDDNRNRAVFIAVGNALLRHLGQIEKTIHCKDTAPPLCAAELVRYIQKNYGTPKIAMIGLQPRMVQYLAQAFPFRVTDLDADNIGQTKFGVLIEGPEQTPANIDWCDLVLATGSTVVNNTADSLLSDKPALFFGVTIAGPAFLLGLNRFCPYGT